MRNVKSFQPRTWALLAGSMMCTLTAHLLGGTDSAHDAIDKASEKLKEFVDKTGGCIEAIQDYLNHHTWGGIVSDPATSDVATLSDAKLNGHSHAVAVHPGDKISGTVKAVLNKDQCSSLAFYRVVLGFQGQGGQTTVCNYFGAVAGESQESFTLTAPAEPGLYQIRFRVVKAFTEAEALNNWVDADNNEPDASTTIGIVYVKG